MNFKLGTEVEFELDQYGIGPRWNNGIDTHGKGIWQRGIIYSIGESGIHLGERRIGVTNLKVTLLWYFYTNMFNNQKLFPGGPQVIIKCECGSDSSSIKGNAYGAHSHWCPKYGKVYHT